MNRPLRLLILTGITSATISATALLASAANAAPSSTGLAHGNGHEKTAVTVAASSAPTESVVPAVPAAVPTSADTNAPQPPSNADFSGNGANVHGPYDSTRDGSPSLNGNGGGQAVGKPCAGCVGKADNKNPKGQLPGGSDHNKGYECDANHGIGRSNPAHTGCTSHVVTPPVVVPPVVTPPVVITPPVESTPPAVNVPVPSGSTSVPQTVETPVTEVNPPVLVTSPVPADAPSTVVDATAEHTLAQTGAAVRITGLAALLSLVAGALMVMGSRRRPGARLH